MRLININYLGNYLGKMNCKTFRCDKVVNNSMITNNISRRDVHSVTFKGAINHAILFNYLIYYSYFYYNVPISS